MRKKLPSQVFSILGPVPVKLVATVDEDNSMGETHFSKRELSVQSGHHPAVMWQIFGHELMHMVLSDANVDDLLTHKKLEKVCDAFGTFLAAWVESGQIVIKTKLPELRSDD